MSQHNSIPAIGQVLYGSVPKLLELQLLSTEVGAAAGIMKANLSVLDTKHPLLLKFFAYVKTAFNASTSNSISVGMTQNGSEFLSAGSITAGTVGFYPASNASVKYYAATNTPIYVRASGAFATVNIDGSSSHNAAVGDTITAGSITYTFVTSLTAPYQVLIGGSGNTDTTLAHLVAAINGAAGAGTTYSTGTVVNPQFTAAAVASHNSVLTAIAGGTAANSIALSSYSAGTAYLTWSASTPAGGTDPTAGEVHVYVEVTELFPDPSNPLAIK